MENMAPVSNHNDAKKETQDAVVKETEQKSEETPSNEASTPVDEPKTDERAAAPVGTKRPVVGTVNEEESREEKRGRTEVLDLAVTLGIEAGDRIEVEWALGENADSTHWWGAKLLPWTDRRAEESGVAIRTLEYDPYPEGGFPESSREDVIFIGKDVLVNYPSEDELAYRLVNGDGAIWLERDDIEEVINMTLENALKKHSKAWNELSMAQKAVIGERVALKKAKLLELLHNHERALITSDDIQMYLTRTMAEEE